MNNNVCVYIYIYIYICMAEFVKAKHTNTRANKEYMRFLLA